jgi:threonine dehydratase
VDAAETTRSAPAVTAVDVLRARRRIAPYVRRTPLVESAWLAEAAGCRVSLKVEAHQRSSSFKLRGAYNAVIARRERHDGGDTPLVTASAGNHGRALAAAAETFGLSLVVFTPSDAPRAKLDAIARHGATLRADAPDYDEAERRAKAFAVATGAAFVSPYNDPDVVAGAGTIAFEIFEDAPDVDTMVVPIGGGGLASGIGIVAKAIAPSGRVVGVEAAASCAFQTSRRAGRLVEIVPGKTLADGLGGNPDPDTITFDLIERVVDDLVTVGEDEIADAIVGLVDAEHLVTEGAGAVGVAALLAGRIVNEPRHIAVVVTGSNIDRRRLADLLNRA